MLWGCKFLTLHAIHVIFLFFVDVKRQKCPCILLPAMSGRVPARPVVALGLLSGPSRARGSRRAVSHALVSKVGLHPPTHHAACSLELGTVGNGGMAP
jgi:hypothetical protein